jgi:ASCH domain-containing protein
MPISEGPRVLSIQQPWAWAIASGHKRVENRSWTTAYRGTVFIHASSKVNRAGIQWIRRTFRIRVPDKLPSGAVVAVAELVDIVTRRRAGRFGRWFDGPYGFVLTRVAGRVKHDRLREARRLKRCDALKRALVTCTQM